MLPAWLASSTQLPAAWKLTTPPEIEQIDELAASTVITTGVRPADEVAVGVYVAPPTVAAGADDVKLTVCVPLPTARLRLAVLLPTVTSFVAPVAPATDAVPAPVGVPVTVHVMVAPEASEETGLGGVHVPSVSPAGRPDALHIAVLAAAVPAVLLFVQTTLPL